VKRNYFGTGLTCSADDADSDTSPISAEMMAGVYIIYAVVVGLALALAVGLRLKHMTGLDKGGETLDHTATEGEMLRALLNKVDALMDADGGEGGGGEGGGGEGEGGDNGGDTDAEDDEGSKRKERPVGLGAVLKRLDSLERRLDGGNDAAASPGGAGAVARSASASASPYARNGDGNGGAPEKKHRKAGSGEQATKRHHRRKPTGSADRLQVEPVTVSRA